MSPSLLRLALAALVLSGCGGASAATPPGEHVGVQSNSGSTTVTLRVAPRAAMTFATDLRISVRSELLSSPMAAELETRGVRHVGASGADGSVSVEEIDTSTRYAITMAGSTRTGPDAQDAPETRRYVLSARGARTDEAPAAPPAAATPQAQMEALLAQRATGALDPLVHALEYPEQPVSIGEQWTSEGRLPLRDLSPGTSGEIFYRLTQRLERFEGSGEQRVAVISFEGSLEGSGAEDAETRISGHVAVRGAYTVALADGFTRTARAEVVGEAQLGEGGLLRFPLQGELTWEATPVAGSRE